MDTGSHLGRDHMNHRITKSFKLGKTFKIVKSNRIIGKILLLIANFTEINVMKSNTTKAIPVRKLLGARFREGLWSYLNQEEFS